MGEDPALVEAWRPRMALLGTGPEDALLVLDALPAHSVVVGRAAMGGDAHLVEHLARGRELEVLPPAEAVGDVEQDLPVPAGLAGRIDCGVDLDGASFGAGRGALVLFVQRARENDVRV